MRLRHPGVDGALARSGANRPDHRGQRQEEAKSEIDCLIADRQYADLGLSHQPGGRTLPDRDISPPRVFEVNRLNKDSERVPRLRTLNGDWSGHRHASDPTDFGSQLGIAVSLHRLPDYARRGAECFDAHEFAGFDVVGGLVKGRELPDVHGSGQRADAVFAHELPITGPDRLCVNGICHVVRPVSGNNDLLSTGQDHYACTRPAWRAIDRSALSAACSRRWSTTSSPPSTTASTRARAPRSSSG